MTIDNLEACSYQKWYPLFSNDTIESVVITLPNDVIEYLRADKLVLPIEAVLNGNPTTSNSDDWQDCDEETPVLEQPSFPAFSARLKDAIRQLGGSVFIKLNWSAPTDAAWITADKTLKCTNLEDVYLLLKSSELIARDLTQRFKCTDSGDGNFCIVLKRWQDIHPGSEFRCFVVQKQLIGFTQRDSKAFYKHIGDAKLDIIEDITNFYQEKIKDHFYLNSYVFDIMRISKGRITLIDLSPFDSKATKPILFTWSELRELSQNNASPSGPEFRFLGEEPGYQPNYYGVPHDVVALCATRSPLSLMDYVTMEVNTQRENEVDEDSENEENPPSQQNSGV